jgi:general stress protein 26
MAADLRKTLFEELTRVQVGFLGVQDPTILHPQPMVHLCSQDRPDIWFLAAADSDLVRMLGDGTRGIYCLAGYNHDFHATLCGPLRPVPDRQGLEKIWSPQAERLFPGGLGDIEWTPLKLSLEEASIWQSRAQIDASVRGCVIQFV